MYVRPPTPPTNDEIELYGEGLLETVEEKLQELMDRADVLKKNREVNLDLVSQYIKNNTTDDFKEWLCTYWANLIYTENDYINIWMKYWIKLYERVKRKTIRLNLYKDGAITEEMVQLAKEKPLKNLYDGELKELGDKLVGICPFHSESTPSFTIFTHDNHFYCFGCNVWGDSIDFKMKTKKISMPEAVRELQE